MLALVPEPVICDRETKNEHGKIIYVCRGEMRPVKARNGTTLCFLCHWCWSVKHRKMCEFCEDDFHVFAHQRSRKLWFCSRGCADKARRERKRQEGAED